MSRTLRARRHLFSRRDHQRIHQPAQITTDPEHIDQIDIRNRPRSERIKALRDERCQGITHRLEAIDSGGFHDSIHPDPPTLTPRKGPETRSLATLSASVTNP